jgi:hypothetical protein
MKYLSEKSYQALFKLAEDKHNEYLGVSPFPHICIDNFFDEPYLDEILNEFPNLDSGDENYNTTNELKFASKGEYRFGDKTREFMHFMNSQPMLEFLSKLTGIKNLIPDPYFWGGGLHQIKRGGFLKIHADFNIHPTMRLDRRINLLVYLNKDWEEEFGGAFELWDDQMSRCEQKIFPLFNRMVIFSTTSTSYHGHPDPLNCHEGRSRKSLALYYYTYGRPEEEIKLGLEEHTTLFRKRKTDTDIEMDTADIDRSINRSNELIEIEDRVQRMNKIKRFIPPILLDLRNKFLARK